ncbi:MAG: endonuclease MutS2 [Candidatus Kapabacteria bacterium]|nr:endonuclease MutS2 [Candidatus Kapabacteria bacterium]
MVNEQAVRGEQDLLAKSLDELDYSRILDVISRRCLTATGSEAVRRLEPCYDSDELRRELDRVDECLRLVLSGETLPLERFEDIRQLVSRCRIEGNFISAPEMLNVLEALQTSRHLKVYVRDRQTLCPNLHMLCEPLVDDRFLEKHITDAIDDTGMVRDNASRELLSIRREIHDTSARLRIRLQRILKKFGEEDVLQDEFITQREGRFVLPLRVESKRAVDGIIHGLSQSGQTVFMEPAETYDMNNELAILRGREQREIIRILTTLSAEIGSVAERILAAFDVMTTFDTTLARAGFAAEYGGVKPVIVDDDQIEMINVRHPLLAIQMRSQPNSVIPLSVRFDDTSRGILISGPNAGGKTVAMKTIGLSLVLSMSGVFPLGMCSLRPRRVLTAIGDHQSIESNLSTFSSQIIRLRDVLSYCDKDALVLIDEICAGTDPAEGGALAAGILDSLLERHACFVVTTHQSSLKQYALTRPSITNASLEFDDVKLHPTFTFLYGVPGNSYAFVLATSVGLPDVVIERARGYLGDRHSELEASINAIQQFRTEAERTRNAAAADYEAARRIRQEAEERLAEVKKRRSSVVTDARQEAEDILRRANALVENTIREIREQQRSIAEVKSDLEVGKKQILSSEEDHGSKDESSTEIKTGDVVTITGTTTSGTVLAIDPKGTMLSIEANGIRFNVPVTNVSRQKGHPPPPRQERRQSSVADHLTFDASTSLDLRGMRVDEGLRSLEEFVNKAILSSLSHGTIIHGKGTGAMRKAVHDYLTEHPHIGSYRLGTIHEGGDGITVIEFR